MLLDAASHSEHRRSDTRIVSDLLHQTSLPSGAAIRLSGDWDNAGEDQRRASLSG